MRRRAVPREGESWVTTTTWLSAWLSLTRPYTTPKRSLEEKRERDLVHVQTQHETVVVFSKLFNLFTSQQKREGPCQIEWLTFMASGHSGQTEMSTSALTNYSSVREVKFLPPVADAPRLWNDGKRPLLTNSNFSAFLCVLQGQPPHPKKVLSCLNLKPGRLWLCREGRYIPNIPQGQWTGRANRWPADCPVPPPLYNREQKSPLKEKKSC